MASVNKVIIVGNLGRDPEVRYSGEGAAICNTSTLPSESTAECLKTLLQSEIASLQRYDVSLERKPRWPHRKFATAVDSESGSFVCISDVLVAMEKVCMSLAAREKGEF